MQGNVPLPVQLAGEIKGWALLRAAIVLLPFLTLSVVMADPLWIEVSLLAIATMIVEDRLDLKPLGVLLHGTAQHLDYADVDLLFEQVRRETVTLISLGR
ncbi:hypothetical protein [Paraburkholderia aromaticivorans]|uniref:hypothetical protein n=1 Tax=Paraburkholderia aromaticivorans TaxID=2026199 RepID=UPI001455E76F|nr:hypothetical protein [Paraburkholderia aromaticivorans]